jgi:type II secretory pathway component PulJ
MRRRIHNDSPKTTGHVASILSPLPTFRWGERARVRGVERGTRPLALALSPADGGEGTRTGKQHRRAQSRRRGLTLLEVLLAAGLGLILMSAVYASLDQAWRLNIQGRTELERNQIARAVLRQIELDVRAVMFESQTASTETPDDADANANAATTEEEDEWTGSLGIRGSATELWIDLSHVSRDLEFQGESTAVRQSDLQTVAYFLSESAMVAAEQTATGAAASPITLQDNDGVGLVRSQGERSVLRSLNSSGSDTILPGPVQMLAPEIELVMFRFFDGLTWYEEWDSSTVGALPRAIEVTITFEPPPTTRGFLLSPAVSASTDSYRLVIPVPVSDPMPPEDTF